MICLLTTVNHEGIEVRAATLVLSINDESQIMNIHLLAL